MSERLCAACNLPKPSGSFYRARCRDCWNAYRREWFGRQGEAQQSDKNRAVQNRAKRQASTLNQAVNRGAAWGQEQDRFLLENWDKPLPDVAASLNRTYDSIAARKKKLKAWGVELGTNTSGTFGD